MTPVPLLCCALIVLSGRDIQMNLSPSLELGAGYDSNILNQNAKKLEAPFSQSSSRFGLDLRWTRRFTFLADYQILYTNYSAGVFSFLDNFVAAGLSIRPAPFLVLNLLGQYEIFDPSLKPEFAGYAFNSVVAFPSLELEWKRFIARGAFYYSILEFPRRPAPSPQVDKKIEPSLLLGYAPRTSTAVSLTYSFIMIRSNFREAIDNERYATLNSVGHGIAFNIWQDLWKRGRVNLRFQAVSRFFEYNIVDARLREDMGYKGSLIFRQGFMDELEGFISLSSLRQGSNNSREKYDKTFVFVGFKVLFDPVLMDRLWREDLSL